MSGGVAMLLALALRTGGGVASEFVGAAVAGVLGCALASTLGGVWMPWAESSCDKSWVSVGAPTLASASCDDAEEASCASRKDWNIVAEVGSLSLACFANLGQKRQSTVL